MQGTIAQLLSITAYGNEYLSDREDNNYFPSNSTFKFCKFVKFVDLQNSGNKWNESEFAEEPTGWFKKLKESGVIQLRVRYISTNNEDVSDRMTAGFIGGGGRWLIEAVKPSESDFWEANWEVGDKDDPEQNIWNVKYGRILRNANQPERPLPHILEVKVQLKEALTKISEFAHSNECGNFAKCFDRGIKALSEQPSSNDNGYIIFPDNYAASDYHQVLNACQSAWVFGGMGSWNDMGFSDNEVHKQYEELSDMLFNLVNLSIIVASNPFPRPKNKSNTTNKEKNKKWWQFWI